MSLLAGLSYKKRLAGIVSISGWAAYRSDLPDRVSEAAKSVPYLFTCGVGDPIVKHELTKESDVELCWVRAASGPFFGEQFISTKSGFMMGFCQWAEMGPKVGQK